MWRRNCVARLGGLTQSNTFQAKGASSLFTSRIRASEPLIVGTARSSLGSTSRIFSSQFTTTASRATASALASTKRIVTTTAVHSKSLTKVPSRAVSFPGQPIRVVVNNHPPRKGRWLRRLIVVGTVVYVVVEMSNGEHKKPGGYLNLLPTRYMSYLFGKFAQWESPPLFNKYLCLIWSDVFGCDLTEMAEPLESFKTFQDFFTRKLKPGVRPIGEGLVSPVDGRVLFIGEMPGDKVERIKGITYELSDFLGEHGVELQDPENNQLYQCVIYLAPGDYHGIHSPTDFTVSERTHFPGLLLPVSVWAVKSVVGLFALNERVVLKGKWKYGSFYITPVGATNVGSIQLTVEPDFLTNERHHKPSIGEEGRPYYRRAYQGDEVKVVPKGESVGVFRLGSTVVLHFEGPKNVTWEIKEGDKLKMGQTMAHIV